MEDLFSMSDAHRAAPTLLVTVGCEENQSDVPVGGKQDEKSIVNVKEKRTGKEHGNNGNQVQSHRDRSERGVRSTSLVDYFTLLLRIPAFQLEVSCVVRWTGFHTVVACEYGEVRQRSVRRRKNGRGR